MPCLKNQMIQYTLKTLAQGLTQWRYTANGYLQVVMKILKFG